MGGGLMQLVAYGAQDIYLTGNPQITFFKVVYRRHTNFSMESIEQTFNGTAKACSRVSCTISRNGDLIHKMYLRIAHSAASCVCTADGIPSSSRGQAVGSPIPVIPDTKAGQDNDDFSVCANDLIDNVEIEIGGQKIDKHYGDWLNIWTQLTCPASKNAGVEELLNLKKGKFSYIPLQFWFCRNPGLALPLIALQYHEVKLNIEFSKSKASGSCNGGMCELTPDSSMWDSATLWVDYIYLDTDERRRFAQVSHEYLIEQLQYTGAESLTGGTSSVRLNFNHPIKELIWRASGMVPKGKVDRRVDLSNNPVVGYSVSGGTEFNVVYKYDPAATTGDGTDSSSTTNVCAAASWSDITLQLNGHERFAERHSEYFRLVQPLQHHTSIPVDSGLHCYSFALKPEEHQPSGTCNFSRIDNAVLKLNGMTTMTAASTSSVGEGTTSFDGNAVLRVYAINYNVLRIMSGMGGLAYSN